MSSLLHLCWIWHLLCVMHNFDRHLVLKIRIKRSIAIRELSQDLTNKKVSAFPFAVCSRTLLHHYLKTKIMQAQLITYQLNDISQAEYLKQMVEPDAPVLANVKGLISKVWLADEQKNTFGGFYLWENKTAMEDFMHSELVKAVVSRPFVKNVTSVDYEVNQTASLITRGLK